MKFLLSVILIIILTIGSKAQVIKYLDSSEHFRANNPKKALEYARLALYNSNKNKSFIGESKLNIGVAHYLLGNRDSAIYWYLSALKDCQSSNNTFGLVKTYTEMCVLYLKQNKVNEARLVIDSAIKYALQLKDIKLLASAYNNKGLVYSYLKEDSLAILSYNTAYKYYKDIADGRGMAYSLSYMAEIAVKNGEINQARTYLSESAVLSNNANDKVGQAVAINNIGELLHNEHDYKEALLYYDSALRIAERINFNDLISYIYNVKSECYELMGNYRLALQLKKSYVDLSSKLANEKLQNKIEELHAQYQLEKKEQINKELKNENKNQAQKIKQHKIILLAVSVIAFLLAGVVVLIINRRRLIIRALKREQELIFEKHKTDTVLQATEDERQRIAREIHDGIGQLIVAAQRNVQILQTKNNLDPTQVISTIHELLGESITEIRLLSKLLMPPLLEKKGLVGAVKDLFIKIETSTNIAIHTSWDGAELIVLDNMSALMLYRCIQEMISNVIKHADATAISFDFVVENDELNIMFYDDGCGFNNSTDINNGLGLSNIKTRLIYIGAQYTLDTKPGYGTTYNIVYKFS